MNQQPAAVTARSLGHRSPATTAGSGLFVLRNCWERDASPLLEEERATELGLPGLVNTADTAALALVQQLSIKALELSEIPVCLGRRLCLPSRLAQGKRGQMLLCEVAAVAPCHPGGCGEARSSPPQTSIPLHCQSRGLNQHSGANSSPRTCAAGFIQDQNLSLSPPRNFYS